MPHRSHDERSAPSRRGGAAATLAAAAILLLPVLYALSLAPVIRLLMALDIDNRWVHNALGAFYTPLLWLIDVWDPLERFYAWYLDLWGVNLG